MHKLAIFWFVVACVVAPVLIVKLSTLLANAIHIYKKRKNWVADAAVLGQADDLPVMTCGIPSIPPERVQISKEYWGVKQTQATHPNLVTNLRQK
jgi:hypothetical protein